MSRFTSATHGLNLSIKMPISVSQVPSIRSNTSKYELQKLRSTGRSVLQTRRQLAIINMTKRSEADDNDGVERRKGVFHPNLWDDGFIQSLSTVYHEQASYRERAERLIGEVKAVFDSISMGDGDQFISPSAYDTAWVARVPAIDGSSRPQFPQAIDWILLNQQQDGSWGSQSHLSLTHRLTDTLACVIALASWKIESVQIDEGLDFITRGVEKLQSESVPAEFEIIFAELLNQAKSLQLSLPYEHSCLQSLWRKQEPILANGLMDSVAKRSLSSLEEMQDHRMNTDSDGTMHVESFLSSPAVAARVLMRTGNPICLAYLNNVLNKFGDYVPGMYPVDLFQRLWMVDNVERLGIDRHFKKEIQVTLDYVYSYWNGKGIGCGRDSLSPDLNSTSLGFRTLRLHGYNVSADVLEHFKDRDGKFVCSSNPTVGEIRSVLNLYRASLLAFPGEKVMEEAETFARRYLEEIVQKIPPSKFSREIEYVLEFGWQSTVPRWEARSYIDFHGLDTYSPWTIYEMASEKFLELAKLEFNIFNSLQHTELQYLSRWWNDSGMSQMRFTRHRNVEYYTMASCIAMEPSQSAFRIGFTKLCGIATCIDDIYDTYGTIDELKLFREAVKRWDPSAIESLPEYMKSVYMVLYELVNEMAQDTERTQGRDTLDYARNAWEAIIDAHLVEAEWIASGHIPTFEEYLENSKVTSGLHIAILPILTLDVPLPDQLPLQEIDTLSRFHHLASTIGRLSGDMNAYKIDLAHGEESSCISCYMKDNPGTTEGDAHNYANVTISYLMKELNLELMGQHNRVSFLRTSKKPAFDIYRASNYMYKYRDGYTIADKETKNLVMRTLVQAVSL
uniref:Pseudolaratriene synthase, chloroplastic n=1 Tax=Pseudolarix amabilis TaxID=3355 RepID=TPS8_PSEAD|nr:RecName: Full=Pseudolaratriene synthase, chloroplastic; AltName: Full=Terpene synthase 8; Short=PxaTPS8; Flags: Precursor [Pseudolarix amabilis]APT40486.1 pseudolarene synthase [Pseudolarix amabilis]